MFIADFCIPLVAITSKNRYAMRPVRDASPRRAPELHQLGITRDNPENIEAQETTDKHHSLTR